MKILTRNVLLISAVTLAFSGAVRADGDGGDNSMSQWTGESYAAFQRGEVGDFYTDPNEMAGTDGATDQTRTEVATAAAGVHAGASVFTGQPGNPFRDDTAA